MLITFKSAFKVVGFYISAGGLSSAVTHLHQTEMTVFDMFAIDLVFIY